MTNMENYALWLIPPLKTYSFLKKLIRELTDQYHIPVFEPHISLICNINEVRSDILKKTSFLTKSITPFSLTLTQVAYFDKKPGGLFFKTKNNQHLNRLIRLAEKGLKYSRKRYQLVPHLTIAYGKLNQKTKEEIIKKLADIKNITFPVKSIFLAITNGDPQEWRKIKKFNLSRPSLS